LKRFIIKQNYFQKFPTLGNTFKTINPQQKCPQERLTSYQRNRPHKINNRTTKQLIAQKTKQTTPTPDNRQQK